MKKPLNPRLGQMILRVVLGVIFVAHGALKLFGGVGGTVAFFGQLGIPIPFLAAWLVTLLEFVGGMFLIVGLFVVPTAILLSVHMLLGIILVHAGNGFFVLGADVPNGMEFNLLLIAGLLSLLLGGSGYAAVDSRMAPRAVAPPSAPAPRVAPEPRAAPEPTPVPEPAPAPAPRPEAAPADVTEAGYVPEEPGGPEPERPASGDIAGQAGQVEDERSGG